MSTRRTVLIVSVTAALACAGYYTYQFVYTWRHIPEAYAAWDTGTLLVRYLETHDDDWPHDWDDLLTVLDDDPHVFLRGRDSDDLSYPDKLRKIIRIDWSFKPETDLDSSPVTCVDGSELYVLWVDPNEMVRVYLQEGRSG